MATSEMATAKKPHPKLCMGKHGKALQQWVLESYRAIWAEFLGTALLVFFGCLGCYSADQSNNHLVAAWAFALIILFLVFIFAKISGAHFNPAVTILAVILRVKSIPLATAYIIAQCSGAIFAAYLIYLITPGHVSMEIYVTQPHDIGLGIGIVVEAFLTWILGLLCCRAWDPRHANQRSVPVQFCIAIGGLAMVGAPLTGGSMNPARTLGTDVIANHWHAHFVYWVGPVLGVVLAALTYKRWFDDHPPNKDDPTVAVDDDLV